MAVIVHSKTVNNNLFLMIILKTPFLYYFHEIINKCTVFKKKLTQFVSHPHHVQKNLIYSYAYHVANISNYDLEINSGTKPRNS